MARLLIVYGTMHGQTANIAERLAAGARGQGHAADLVNIGAMPVAPSPAACDAVIRAKGAMRQDG